MSDVLKVTDEELALLKKLQSEWHRLTKTLGELHYEKRVVEEGLTAVNEDLDKLDVQRLDAIKAIETKYGEGNVDLTTGTFVKS